MKTLLRIGLILMAALLVAGVTYWIGSVHSAATEMSGAEAFHGGRERPEGFRPVAEGLRPERGGFPQAGHVEAAGPDLLGFLEFGSVLLQLALIILVVRGGVSLVNFVRRRLRPI